MQMVFECIAFVDFCCYSQYRINEKWGPSSLALRISNRMSSRGGWAASPQWCPVPAVIWIRVSWQSCSAESPHRAAESPLCHGDTCAATTTATQARAANATAPQDVFRVFGHRTADEARIHREAATPSPCVGCGGTSSPIIVSTRKK